MPLAASSSPSDRWSGEFGHPTMRTVSDRSRATGRYPGRRNVSGRDAATPDGQPRCPQACDIQADWTVRVCVCYAISMSLLHRIMVVVLLACVPFQAAMGASGFVCPNGAHHSDSSIALADHHEATALGQHRALDASAADDHAVPDPSPGSDGHGK